MSNKVLDDFNNWVPANDNDIVGIVGMKWTDENHESFTTHSFYNKDDLKSIEFHGLALIEILCNLYDISRADPLSKKSYDKIMNIVEKVINKVVKL